MICFRYFSRQRYDLASRNANILAICQVKKTKRRGKKDDTATCMEAYFLHNSLYILYTQTSQVPSNRLHTMPFSSMKWALFGTDRQVTLIEGKTFVKT